MARNGHVTKKTHPQRKQTLMSDDVTAETSEHSAVTEPVEPAGDQDATATVEEPTQAPKPTETVEFWKKMARKNEAQAKENFADAKKWRESQEKIGDDPLSRIEELERKFETAERERIRSNVARETKVDPEFIHGDTEEEMRESADRWNEFVNKRIEEALKAKLASSAVPTSEVTSDKKVEGPKPLTPAEYAALPPAERKKAREEGRLDSYLRGELH
ncbi:head scaffolding protein [Mycobacterium phage Empress]|uniref:Scaffolding protein n=1 Tax=Mycobacterium phage Empress TaxID=1913118 RepID=A0A1J0GWG7_9CAUD|nr:head scaffolding protein [Mycobacterium phage Empress]APC46588.1 scaffolding protein [Mycobacterium phage Empress]ASJ79605.1 scaffolding protein [Mycobacterium phage Pippy]